MISNQFVHFIGRIRHRQENSDRVIGLIILVIMLSVTPIGYHIIALNVPSGVIQRAIASEFRHIQLSSTSLDMIWSFIVSCQSIGALIGCFLVVPMERHFGTKRSLLLLNNLLLIFASLAFMTISERTNVLVLLTIGRLLVGLYTGIGCALVPVYVQELSPHQLKGTLCCFVHIAICAGSALGAFLSLENILGGPSSWTALLSLPVLLALAQIILGQFLMETPSFFLRRNDQMAAANSIRFHYALSEHLDAETVIREYQSTVSKLPPQISLRQACNEPKMRAQILLGMAISVAQIFSGSMAAVSYSTEMLESVSLTAWLTPFIPTLGSLLSIAMTLPALQLVQSCGRKQLLVNTLAICATANFLLVLFSVLAQLFAGPNQHEQSWASIGFLLCFFLYGIGYNVGVGPVAYFLPAELVPPMAISAAMGAATSVNWLSSMLTTIVYYPLNEAIGGWSFLVFAVPTTLFAIFFHRKLPADIGDEPSENIGGSRNAEIVHHDDDGPCCSSSMTANGATTMGRHMPSNSMIAIRGRAEEEEDYASAAEEPTRRRPPTAVPFERTPLRHQTSVTSAGTAQSSGGTSWYSTFGDGPSSP